MLSHARRYVIFAVLGSFLALGAACTTAIAGSDEQGPSEQQIRDSAPPPVVEPQMYSMSLRNMLRTGRQPFQCGQPDEGHGANLEPGFDCRISVKLTVPKKVAKWLRLDSRVLARGVAGDMVENYKGYRAYFLKVPHISSLKAKLKRKRVRALGGDITGNVTARGHEQIQCEDDGPLKAQCPLTGDSGDKGDTHFLWQPPENMSMCWPYMPYYVGVTVKWGEMCPRPIKA